MNNITLAICMYNAERYIEETLRCVMAQTMQEFHLLIVNDCSTDDSVDVIERFFKENPRQHEIVTLEVNNGIAYARNNALGRATTKYILFVDSDDLFDDKLIEKEYNRICNDDELMCVSCYSQFIDEKGKKVYGGTYLGETTKEAFIEKAKNRKLIFLPIHTIFNREVAIKAGGFTVSGFPEGKPRFSDYCEELDLWTRMSDFYKCGKAMVVLPEVLYYYRKTDGLSYNHFNMCLKMKYTKQNLLRRRNGLNELSFIEFYDSIDKAEIKRLKIDASAADNLRNAAFYIKHGKIASGFFCLIKSIWQRPLYIIDKLRHNLIKGLK